MFEQETEELIRIIGHRTAEGGSDVSLGHILAADIPTALKTYFRADVESILHEEQHRHEQQSRFDHDSPEIRILQQQLHSILMLNYSYPRNLYHERLAEAVHRLVNFLATPQAALLETLFGQTQSITREDLERLLRSYQPYGYLRILLLAYLNQNNILLIDREALSNLVSKLDREFIRRKNGQQIATLLAPFFGFINYLRVSEEPSLPLAAIERYFEDKGFTQDAPVLVNLHTLEKNTLSNNSLAALLDDCIHTNGPLTAASRGITPKSIFVPPPPKENINPTPISPSVETHLISFDEQDRRRFIKKIFNQDEEAFTVAIDKLQHLSHWKEVSRAIDEIFISRVIDPYSSDAVRFLELFYKEYHQS